MGGTYQFTLFLVFSSYVGFASREVNELHRDVNKILENTLLNGRSKFQYSTELDRAELNVPVSVFGPIMWILLYGQFIIIL